MCSDRVAIEILRQRVAYDPTTGDLTWKPCGSEHFADERSWRSWTTRFAGNPVLKRQRGRVVVTLTVAGQEIHMQGSRVAWALMTGEWPSAQVDHEDRDPSNNRWGNLRLATHQQNQWNKGVGLRNASGFKGVHWHAPSQKWRAQITANGRRKSLGLFDCASDAGAAYIEADRAAHGQFAAA